MASSKPPNFPPTSPTRLSGTFTADSLPDISTSSERQVGHTKTKSEDNRPKQRSTSSVSKMSDPANVVDDTLRNFKWIEAIRSGDIAVLSLLLSQNRIPSVGQHGTPLHLCAAFGSRNVLEHLLKSSIQFPVNAQDSNRNTALHIACKAGRAVIVEALLKLSSIDACVLNSEGKDCKDVAKTTLITEMVEASRKSFSHVKTKEMFGFATSGNMGAVRSMFTDPRVAKLVDVNTQDHMSEATLLHYAAEQNDVDMVNWVLKMKAGITPRLHSRLIGVDVMVRDKLGTLAYEKTKNEKIKQLLKEVMSQPSVVATSSGGGLSIKMQGVLYKWTNFAKGYKKRWFVLQDGIFSYYRRQEEYPVSCRGSIALKVSKLTIDSSDRNRFEIVGPGNVRYHVRAEHPTEARKWIIALTETKQWLQDNSAYSKMSTSTTQLPNVVQNDSDTDIDNHSQSSDNDASKKHNRGSNLSVYEDADGKDFVYEEEFQAIVNSALASVRMQEQTFSTLSIISAPEKLLEVAESLKKSSKTLVNAFEEIIRLSSDREKHWEKTLEREERIKRVWEENLSALAAEHDALQFKAAEEVNTLKSQAHALSLSRMGINDQNDEDEFYDAISDLARDMKQKDQDALDNGKALIVASLNGYPPVEELRSSLPKTSADKVEISLWSVLRNNIGKDLSKIALPVFFNEPVSMLQRLCEEMEYSTLLDIASSKETSLERIEFVAAFAMSNYSSTLGRTGKPFNPLLGETYEYVRKDRGFRYISEQVSHHPPISACYCESDNYVFWAEANLKNKFWGKSLEVFPQGDCHLLLKKTNEHFTWRKVTTCVNNLIVGKLWIDHYGDMEILNHATKESCILTFAAAGWRGKGQYEISGKVKDASGAVKLAISGQWNDKLATRPLDGGPSTILWKRSPIPKDAEQMFNFTDFAVTLNQCDGSLAKFICPTDSRFRPDQRAMERGDYDMADKEKIRLEEQQRVKRHELHDSGKEWRPSWFKLENDPDSGNPTWTYKGGYWEAREGGWPKDLPVIY